MDSAQASVAHDRTRTPPSYGANVPLFEEKHPGLRLSQGHAYYGFTARHAPTGSEVWERTLDDLAPLASELLEFLADYPGVRVRQGVQFSGYSARLLIEGRPKGAEVWAKTLHDLGPLVEAELGPLSQLPLPARDDETPESQD